MTVQSLYNEGLLLSEKRKVFFFNSFSKRWTFELLYLVIKPAF